MSSSSPSNPGQKELPTPLPDAGASVTGPLRKAADSEPARQRPSFCPVIIEVAGSLEDAVVRDVTQRLHRYRNRYLPILRCGFTLVAAAVPEAQLFGDRCPVDAADAPPCIGDDTALSVQAQTWPSPLFKAPRFAVCINKALPLVTRLYPSITSKGEEHEVHVVGGSPEGAGATAASMEVLPVPSGGPYGPSEVSWTDASPALALSEISKLGVHERAVRRLEDFMSFHFLPFAMTHHRPSRRSGASTNTFVLRHYLNEASRTASFLFLDPYRVATSADEGHSAPPVKAALVDPRVELLESYGADLLRFGAVITYIIFTHCYVDGASGLGQLLDRFPKAQVLSGFPLAAAGTTEDALLSPALRLRTVRVPAFSPECLLVEVHFEDELAGICSGVLCSMDALPRWDLLRWEAFPPSALLSNSTPPSTLSASADRDKLLADTHEVLARHLFDRYLRPLCTTGGGGRWGRNGTSKTPHEDDRRGIAATSPSVSPSNGGTCDEGERGVDKWIDADVLRRVVLLPSHGGNNNVTHQLDLYWAAHLGDIMRMKHSRAVLDTLQSAADMFAQYHRRLPPLPHPLLFDVSRVEHLRNLIARLPTNVGTAAVAQLPPDMQHALQCSLGGSPVSDLADLRGPHMPPLFTYVNVIDVREAADYHKLHLHGAINVPMSFPCTAYQARRAELWLQCTLVPCQPILALCASAAQREEVYGRLSAFFPGYALGVFALTDLPQEPAEAPTTSAALPETSSSPSLSLQPPWRVLYSDKPANLSDRIDVPPQLLWVQRSDAFPRLTVHEDMTVVEPEETRIVLDVRTPYEFRNGSHQHSAHVELAGLCAMAVADVMTTLQPTRMLRSDAALPAMEHVHQKQWHTGSSPKLVTTYMTTIHSAAMVAGLPIVHQPTAVKEIVIYCADGYRSLIAASLLQRALESAIVGTTTTSDATTRTAWQALRIVDVSGGAHQIMTQRPDLWHVKDRSIVSNN